MRARHPSLLALPPLLLAAACSIGSEPEPAAPTVDDLVGSWRAVLQSPGGELPFGLEIESSNGFLAGAAVNGEERVPFSDVTLEGEDVRLVFAWYDSRIEARLDAGAQRLDGTWTKTVPAGVSSLPFEAERVAGGSEGYGGSGAIGSAAAASEPGVPQAPEPSRFRPLAEVGLEPGAGGVLRSVDGIWEAVFTDDDGTEPARGEFRQRGTRVSGTFLTPTGDYRFLDGSYENGLLRLSTFDGGHAFLFHARARPDGTLEGDFWSRDTYHATWTARRVEPARPVIPDAWELVGLAGDDGRLEFTFPDLAGRPVSLADRRFAGRVVLVNVFGSWCPNCNDEAPLLAEWARRYRDRGFDVVGLAYEFTDDVERSRDMVQRFKVRHGIDYPLLIAGTSDKTAAAQTLPDLTSVVAYPTTIFVDRSGTVRAIHSGFSGPGTGEHYDELVAEMTGLIEKLLAEEA